MGRQMELSDPPPPRFDPPQLAIDDYSPGMSPYIHRWLEMHGRPPGAAAPDQPPLSSQTEKALRDLIDTALGYDGAVL